MGLMGKYSVYVQYLRLFSVEVQFGVIPCTPILADLLHVVSQKWLVVKQNGPTFGPQG